MAPDDSTSTAAERRERLRRRLVAARVLAGLGQKELALRIRDMGHTRGYSARTIGDMERGETPIQPQSLRVFAEACSLPVEFFTADFETLAAVPAPSGPDLEGQIEELRAQQVEDAIRLAQLEEAVQALGATGHRPKAAGGGQR